MTTRILLTFITFLAICGTAESICCDKIKSEVKKKHHAYETLCKKDTRLSKDCCKDMKDVVDDFQDAYNNLCTGIVTSVGKCDNPRPLGLESGKITNSAMTASSAYSKTGWLPTFARLNKNMGTGCCWAHAAGKNPSTSWLQVDLGSRTTVTSVATQGRCDANYWTKTYVIWYSDDGNNWRYFKEGGTIKVFNGNSDRNTVVTNTFQPPIIARYMRISPRSYYRYADIRMEYYGCRIRH